MKILVADQDPQVLEAVARAFEVDVATSKATCLDLLRANDFDLIIACERLTDGSGLELLSQVAQRWPSVLRVLSIESSRLALLKGRLGPFKLFDILPYPLEAEDIETVLQRAAALPRDESEREVNEPAHVQPSRVNARAGSAAASSRKVSQASAVPSRRVPSAQVKTSDTRSKTVPQLPRIVPLGSPAAADYKILPHNYYETESTPRRFRREPARQESLSEKAAALAADALATVSAALGRYIRPGETPRPETAPASRNKRRERV